MPETNQTACSKKSECAQKMEFTQNDAELTVCFELPTEIQTRDIKCLIKAQRLEVKISGQTEFEDDLIGKIDPDESTWEIEKEKSGSKKLAVTLVKVNKKTWKCVGKKEADDIKKQGDGVHLYTMDDLNPDDNSENAAKNQHDEKVLEAEFLKLRSDNGLDDTKTLEKFFQLFDNSIQLYRLNMLHQYLNDIVPICRQRSDQYKIKAIQAYAFVLWKQNKFREALPIFHEMEDMLGQNGPLCENIAHTYNSMGNYDKAEEYFAAALKFCQNDESDTSQKGGVLLGLGLVRDRQDKPKDAEKIVRQSYEFYKRRAKGDLSSLQAKAAVALGKILTKLGREDEAETLLKDATSIYEVTCGSESPLTCSGYTELGQLQWKRDKRIEARANLSKGYLIAIRKDHLDIVQLMEVHNTLLETITNKVDVIDRTQFKDFKHVIEEGVSRIRTVPKQDGNTGVYYKLAGEFLCWCADYEEGKSLLMEALGLFQMETSCDCTKLINESTQMIRYCERCLSGAQESPMDLPVDEKRKKQIEDKNVECEDDEEQDDILTVEDVTQEEKSSSSIAQSAEEKPKDSGK